MASLISEVRSGRTLYRIQFQNASKQRRYVRLAGVSKKDAEGIRRRIEALNSCRISGQPLAPDLAAWTAGLGDDLHGKLVTVGLLEPRQKQERWTLGAFVDEYIASRADVEDRTHINWRMTRHKLTDYFGEDRDLLSITEADAFEWRQHLAKTYASATLANHVKFAKAFFKHAMRKRIIAQNPFAELKGAATHNSERHAFISHETILQAIEACPDAQWRLILALCRFGGLRCPSEVLSLRWCDVDWEAKRLTVISPKTRKQGKGFRVVPLFPELEPYLADAFECAEEESVYCVTRYRSQDVNLRTQLLKILRRAGVEPWERLFQNLRSSRETELANEFPLHVVTAWLGNTPRVADKHYLQVTADHYAQAVARVELQVEPKVSESGSRRSQPLSENPENSRGNAVFPTFPAVDEYTPLDSNQ